MIFAFVLVSLTLLIFNACLIANGTKIQLNKFSQLQFSFVSYLFAVRVSANDNGTMQS